MRPRRRWLPLCVLLAALPGAAQVFLFVYPAHPVDVELRVDGDAVRAAVDNNAVVWEEIVLGGVRFGPGGWKEAWKRGVEDEFNRGFRLSADGRRLRGKLERASYHENPWELRGGGIHLEFSYSLPAGARTLAVEADLFEDHRRALAQRPDFDSTYAAAFVTRVTVAGRDASRFELRSGDPAVDVDLGAARRSGFQRLAEGAAAGFFKVFRFQALLLFLAAALFTLRPGFPVGPGAALFTAGLAAGFFAGPRVAESAVWWSALAAALAAVWGAPAAVWLALLALGGGLSGAALASGMGETLLPFGPASGGGVAYLLGVDAGVDVFVTAVMAALWRHRQAVERLSAALADRFERRRLRLAAVAVGAVCAIRLFRLVTGGF